MASSSSSSSSAITMKLVINPETQKVIYAEASKDLVGFIKHVLSMPDQIKQFVKNTPLTEFWKVPPPPAGIDDDQQEVNDGVNMTTYMVTDDLVMRPMSAILRFIMLHKFNDKEIRALEEKVVDFRAEESIRLLKASMETKNVLTTVFLKPTN